MVTLPSELRHSLEGSPFESVTLRLAEASTVILKDNKMPFFPAYTDHGCEHVECVLNAAVRLVPDDVWSQKLIQAQDAAILICSVFLHDLALHVRAAGFVELVSSTSPLKPLPWFDSQQGTRPADLPWSALWRAFRKEARHFTQSQLDRMLGPANDGVPAIAFGDHTLHPADWTEADHLLIGEFLRRHHARLAHEIAIFGFPGAITEYPRLSTAVPELADAMGLVARSHNEPMRTCLDYLAYLQPGNQRPFGALVPYLIGLIRTADYFQLEASRAPSLLLHLKEPPSPQSIDEWNKHKAIGSISWFVTDPLAIFIEVTATHRLRTHLQLAELFSDLQRELDTTTAVLSETYSTPTLGLLRLARQRIRTNLVEPSLHARLPFVPKKSALRSAEDLFRLVIGDLYGNQPAVAGRELVQNAVDSIRERRRWEAHFQLAVSDSDFREQDADVEVILSETPDGVSLRVSDRGVGMTPATVISYFLTAGATFAFSSGELDLDRETAVSWMKTGRFGVGAFAAFLLGSEMRVTTRHLGSDKAVTFLARIDDDLVQLDWTDAPFGTEVIVPLSAVGGPADLRGSELEEFFDQVRGFYRLPSPTVRFMFSGPDIETTVRDGPADVPAPGLPLTDEWRALHADGFDAVFWRAGEPRHDLVYNGIRVYNPAAPAGSRAIYRWSDRRVEQMIRTPDLVVFDSKHVLGVSLTRYQLSERAIPFERALLYSIGRDVAARALVAGVTDHVLGKGWGFRSVCTRQTMLPFVPKLLQRYLETTLCVMWISPDSWGQVDARFVDEPNGEYWRRFPTRVALQPPRSLYSQVDGRAITALALTDIDEGTRLLARILGGDVVAKVGVSSDAAIFQEAVGTRWQAWPPEVDEDVDDVEGDDEVGQPALASFACWGDDQDQVITGMLCGLGDDLVASGGASRVGLSLVQLRSEAAVDLDPVSQAWSDLIGGHVARNADKRDATAESIYEEQPESRELLDKWREVLREDY
jgi:molecular chaperone HtpG